LTVRDYITNPECYKDKFLQALRPMRSVLDKTEGRQYTWILRRR
jgi:hypothetical protein